MLFLTTMWNDTHLNGSFLVFLFDKSLKLVVALRVGHFFFSSSSRTIHPRQWQKSMAVLTSKRDAPRHKKNKWLYDNKVTQENNQQLRKACKVAIKFLRLKTIKKLQRTKETSHERQALIDKLQVLRTLKVDSVLSAIQGMFCCWC